MLDDLQIAQIRKATKEGRLEEYLAAQAVESAKKITLKPEDINPIGFDMSKEFRKEIAKLANDTMVLRPFKGVAAQRLGIRDTKYGDLRLTVRKSGAELEIFRRPNESESEAKS